MNAVRTILPVCVMRYTEWKIRDLKPRKQETHIMAVAYLILTWLMGFFSGICVLYLLSN